MAKRNRATLKQFFQHGNVPTAAHFEDFIDSTSNMVEDLIHRAAPYGHEIVAEGKKHLLRLFHKAEDKLPQWAVEMHALEKDLHIKCADAIADKTLPHLSLSTQGHVGINKPKPQSTLDVGGQIRAHHVEAKAISAGHVLMQSRIGKPLLDEAGNKQILADGLWHTVTPPLKGFQAFELMAIVSTEHTRLIAHATAVQAGRLKNPAQPTPEPSKQASKPPTKKSLWAVLTDANANANDDNDNDNDAGEVKDSPKDEASQAGINLTTTSFGEQDSAVLQLRWQTVGDEQYTLDIRSSEALADAPQIRCYLTRLWAEEP